MSFLNSNIEYIFFGKGKKIYRIGVRVSYIVGLLLVYMVLFYK